MGAMKGKQVQDTAGTNPSLRPATNLNEDLIVACSLRMVSGG